MTYIFREHYLLTSMPNNVDSNTRALVYEPKLELAQLYAKYLRLQEIESYICGSPSVLAELANTVYPHILIYNIDDGFESLKSLKYDHPAILIITIGDMADNHLGSLMELGISGHMNRKITHPRDVGILARQLLKY